MGIVVCYWHHPGTIFKVQASDPRLLDGFFFDRWDVRRGRPTHAQVQVGVRPPGSEISLTLAGIFQSRWTPWLFLATTNHLPVQYGNLCRKYCTSHAKVYTKTWSCSVDRAEQTDSNLTSYGIFYPTHILTRYKPMRDAAQKIWTESIFLCQRLLGKFRNECVCIRQSARLRITYYHHHNSDPG